MKRTDTRTATGTDEDACECSKLQCKQKSRDNYCDGSCGCGACRFHHTETAEISSLYESDL